jgi:hypothetical protein
MAQAYDNFGARDHKIVDDFGRKTPQCGSCPICRLETPRFVNSGERQV